MHLSDFIDAHVDEIVDEALTFSKTLLPAAGHLDEAALRDHLPMILHAIAKDLATTQSGDEELRKSRGKALALDDAAATAAQTHALLRAKAGFDINQMVSEYRALRASVLRLWLSSPRSRDEEALAEVVRFNEAVDQAVAESVSHFSLEAERWRNVFLAVLGHDLRGPLNAVLLTAQVLSKQSLDEPTSAHAERLIKSGRRMRDLLDSLLDYSRSSLGQGIAVVRLPVDLASECAEEIEILRDALPGRVIELSIFGRTTGNFDASRVREALANLVHNAASHGAPNRPIAVSLLGSDHGVRLLVVNEGPGIPAGTAALLFDPLRRGTDASAVEATSRTNLGLGLFIVQAIARAHGGSVDTTSGQGKTRFEVLLPCGDA